MRTHPFRLVVLLLLIPVPAVAGDLFEQIGIRTHGFHFLEGARAEIGTVNPDQGSSAAVFGLNSSAGTFISPAFDLTLGLRYWSADLELDDASTSNGSMSDFSLHGDLNYHILKIFGLRPYGLAGVGAHFISADVPGDNLLEDAIGGFNFGVDLGVGIASAGKGLGFRVEARREQVEEASAWNYTVGVGWWPGEKAVRAPKTAATTAPATSTPAAAPASPAPAGGGLSYAEAAALQTTIDRLASENAALKAQAGGAAPATVPAASGMTVSTPESRAAAQRDAFRRMASLSGDPGGYSDAPPGPRFDSENFVSFQEGGSKLDARDLQQIRRLAVLLLMFPGTTANLEGHADSGGSVAANQKVTTARAEAVRGELLRLGVSSGAIEAAGIGSSRPLANTSAENRLANRRVSVRVAGSTPR